MEKSTLKAVIITGANSGLGFETAKKIATDTNFRLILACRNSEKIETSTPAFPQNRINGMTCYARGLARIKCRLYR